MALFIRDEEVERLVTETQKALKTTTKKEAVRLALEGELRRVRDKGTIFERVKRSQELAAALGPGDPNFDMKKFTDEMWGDI